MRSPGRFFLRVFYLFLPAAGAEELFASGDADASASGEGEAFIPGMEEGRAV